MLYVYVVSLGAVAGFTLRWPGLVFLVSILSAASGLAGAVHHQPFAAIAVQTVLVVCALEVAYCIPVLIQWMRPQAFDASRPWK